MKIFTFIQIIGLNILIISLAFQAANLRKRVNSLEIEINSMKSPKTLLLPLPLPEETLIQEN
jgi:hypothetical protein